jgi:hypothetical protein
VSSSLAVSFSLGVCFFALPSLTVLDDVVVGWAAEIAEAGGLLRNWGASRGGETDK